MYLQLKCKTGYVPVLHFYQKKSTQGGKHTAKAMVCEI